MHLDPSPELENRNSRAYLDKCTALILENLRSLAAAPSVQFSEVPPDWAMREVEETLRDGGGSAAPDARAGAAGSGASGRLMAGHSVIDGRRHHDAELYDGDGDVDADEAGDAERAERAATAAAGGGASGSGGRVGGGDAEADAGVEAAQGRDAGVDDARGGGAPVDLAAEGQGQSRAALEEPVDAAAGAAPVAGGERDSNSRAVPGAGLGDAPVLPGEGPPPSGS